MTKNKKLHFPNVVDGAIALVARIADYYQHLEAAGHASLMPQGLRAMTHGPDIAARAAALSQSAEHEDKMLSLFRDCREIINPAQSALQNLMRNHSRVDAVLYHDGHKNPQRGDVLLSSIIRAKEDWAFIEAHPQVVFHQPIMRPQTVAGNF
jgi:hypothetical protein